MEVGVFPHARSGLLSEFTVHGGAALSLTVYTFSRLGERSRLCQILARVPIRCTKLHFLITAKLEPGHHVPVSLIVQHNAQETSSAQQDQQAPISEHNRTGRSEAVAQDLSDRVASEPTIPVYEVNAGHSDVSRFCRASVHTAAFQQSATCRS